jgi:hypothetical protein
MVIEDKDIIFVTDTIFTKWIGYQKKIINNFFPGSRHVIIDGTKRWPECWFDWIDIVKSSGCKWYIHIEEDCFIEDKDSILEAIEKMEKEEIAVMGTADGYQPYRGGNPLTMTPFFLIGRTLDLQDIDINLKDLTFRMKPDGTWSNSLGIEYKDSYSEGFSYPYEKIGNDGKMGKGDIEPFYALFWKIHEKKKKLHYFYPNFGDDLKSLNPSLSKGSTPMVVHMFYTRMWESNMDVHGLPNVERYRRLERYLLNKHKFLSN